MTARLTRQRLLLLAAAWAACISLIIAFLFISAATAFGIVYGTFVFGLAFAAFSAVAARSNRVLTSDHGRAWLVASAGASCVAAFATFSPLGFAFYVLPFGAFVVLAIFPQRAVG
jgi:hypothetical protein